MAAPRLRDELHFADRVVRCYADRPADVVALLEAAVAAGPNDDAVVDGEVRLSFAELWRAAAGVAVELAALGFAQGDRLGVLLPNGWPFVVVIVGAWRAGVVPVPISTRATPADIAFLVGDCSARAVVVDPAMAERLPLDASPVLTDPARLERWRQGGTPGPVARREEDTALLLYTSGTTGRPKGAMLTDLNLVHSCLHFRHVFGLTSADRAVLAVPATHVTGIVGLVLTPLAAGGTVLVLPSFDACGFLELAARERMTWTILVPAMYNLCLLRARLADYDLGAWRIGCYGGAAMPEATIEALARELPHLALANAYGATETTSASTLMPLDDGGAHASSVGRAVPCAEVRIMDDEGREQEPGATGEVWIRGPMVVPGYWQRPDETARAFRGGFWRSGDIGALDAEGYLRVFDRKKDLINRGGYKVYSVEVENTLLAHPAIADAAVVPAADPVLGEKVHAFVQVRTPVDAATLRAHCAACLADYKVPDDFTLDETPLPRNANGKLQKQVLRQRLAAAELGAAPPIR